MDNTTTSSLLLGHIADCAKAVPQLGINHVHVAGGLLKASNFHNHIYVNVNVSSLDHKEEAKRLDLSIEASPRNISLLRSVGKTTNPKKKESKDIGVTTSCSSYSLTDEHRKTEIRKIAVKQPTATIADFILLGEAQGTAITLTGKDELSLKGNETCVFLGIYGGQLASVIAPGQPEHFFADNTARQFSRTDKNLYRSYGFLKFGEPDFDLALYSINGGIWLLTTGIFADKLSFQVIEKLTKLI